MLFYLDVKRTVDILNPAMDRLAETNEIRKINECSLPVIINLNKRITFGIPRINNKAVLINICRIISINLVFVFVEFQII
jgi:hypothetical protein